MVILENIDIDIDIDKAILENIDIDKISNRFKFGISNRASSKGSRNEISEYAEDLAVNWHSGFIAHVYNCNFKRVVAMSP